MIKILAYINISSIVIYFILGKQTKSSVFYMPLFSRQQPHYFLRSRILWLVLFVGTSCLGWWLFYSPITAHKDTQLLNPLQTTTPSEQKPYKPSQEWQVRGAWTALNDSMPSVKAEALEHLIEWGKTNQIAEQQLLVYLLQKQDYYLQQAASTILSERKNLSPVMRKRLIDLLKSHNTSVQKATAESLKGQSNLPEEAIRQLLVLLESKDGFTALAAAGTLNKQAALSQAVVLNLIVMLTNEKRAHTAAFALDNRKLNQEALQKLIVYVKSEQR